MESSAAPGPTKLSSQSKHGAKVKDRRENAAEGRHHAMGACHYVAAHVLPDDVALALHTTHTLIVTSGFSGFSV